MTARKFEHTARDVIKLAMEDLPPGADAIMIAIIGSDGTALSGFTDPEDKMRIIMTLCDSVIDGEAARTCPHCVPIEAACRVIFEVCKKLFDHLDKTEHNEEVLH